MEVAALPRALAKAKANILDYGSDSANPAAVYKDPAPRDLYLKMNGPFAMTAVTTTSILWSSERKWSRVAAQREIIATTT